MSEIFQPDLTTYYAAMADEKVLLPNGEIVAIRRHDIATSYDADVWCDEFDVIIEPEYEHGVATFVDTIVNAGLIRPSGEQRFRFVVENNSLRRAGGDMFDWEEMFIDRHLLTADWRKERTLCDAFTMYPRRCMNRLKDRVFVPRSETLYRSEDDNLLWRLCYLGLARKVFLARAGYPEFCARLT